MLIWKGLVLLMRFVVVTQNKEDSEKDEKRDEERQKSKRGRPPLKSTFSSNMPYSLSKTSNSEGKSGTRNAHGSVTGSSPLSRETEGAQCQGLLTFKTLYMHMHYLTMGTQSKKGLSLYKCHRGCLPN